MADQGALPAFETTGYYRYPQLSTLIHDWARQRPTLARCYSLGRTLESREIWCVEITNTATGLAEDKPAYYIDANIHAGEVTGSSVALYTIHHLLTEYGADPFVTRLLDDFAFYIVPRIAMDGAELYLTTPELLRSSVRAYPPDLEVEGIERRDLDGDGWAVQMRVPDRTGGWKISERDPRAMVRRAPDEYGAEYFRLYPEGLITDFQGVEVKVAPSRLGLDVNRNFPANWAPEGVQSGAGPYPLSEPESRAVAEFMLSHRNIAGAQHYHTQSAVILRPFSGKPDSALPKRDLEAYELIGRLGTEATGWPVVSTFHGFTDDPDAPRAGIHLDWTYEHLGILVFSTELWSAAKAAGLEVGHYARFWRELDEEQQLRLLAWNDAELGGAGFVDWHPFDHPQLGPVEIGGWKVKYVFQNPPPGRYLAELCRANCRFTLRAAASSPRLRLPEVQVTPLDAGLYRVRAVVENEGFLPTNVTEQAIKLKVARPVRVELFPSVGAELVGGQRRQEIGHLAGRIEQARVHLLWGSVGNGARRAVEWLVRATAPDAVVTVRATCDRAGHVSRQVPLPS